MSGMDGPSALMDTLISPSSTMEELPGGVVKTSGDVGGKAGKGMDPDDAKKLVR